MSAGSLLLLGLLGMSFWSGRAQAREAPQKPQEDQAAAASPSNQSFVYDEKTGKFVRGHGTSEKSVGNFKIDVGYNPEMTRVREEVWPISVNRYLYRRPLDH